MVGSGGFLWILLVLVNSGGFWWVLVYFGALWAMVDSGALVGSGGF
jgi:hypothetical protein